MAGQQVGGRLGRVIEVAVVAAGIRVPVVGFRLRSARIGSGGSDALPGLFAQRRVDGFGGRGGRGGGSRGLGRRLAYAAPTPGDALGSTMVSILKSAPRTTTIASRSTSSLPPRPKLSRAPALDMASSKVLSRSSVTWAFWLSRIQVNRRLPLTSSSTSGQSRRTSVTVSRASGGAGGVRQAQRHVP